uniref:hypothetical protein n=1 Tax=Herbidospora sakaeratensis TaxID=564415 RepID=UPI000A7E0335|nr:hypothetical protein [Herbidospora sakaeratensis]
MRSMRSALRVLVAAAVATALIPAAPASAGIWQLTEGFESPPAPRLRWTNSDPNVCGVPSWGGWALNPRTGSGLASIAALDPGEWCWIARTIQLTPVTAHPGARCGLGVWATVTGRNTALNVEVIDPDTWTYIAFAALTPDGTRNYRQVSAGWTARRTDVVVRFSIVNPAGSGSVATSDLDDLVVQCAY